MRHWHIKNDDKKDIMSGNIILIDSSCCWLVYQIKADSGCFQSSFSRMLGGDANEAMLGMI